MSVYCQQYTAYQSECCVSTRADDSLADIGASESIMKKKTKQDFQELLKTEHCKMIDSGLAE